MPVQEQSEKQSPASTFGPFEEGALPVTRIEPSKGWPFPKIHELWQARELLYFLIWRDVKVRYKQTVLGAAWAILQPFFTDHPIRTHSDSQNTDLKRQRAFGLGMIEKGFFVNPTGKLYLSTAHTQEIVDQTLEAARAVLSEFG